jgi:hypothetical protein
MTDAPLRAGAVMLLEHSDRWQRAEREISAALSIQEQGCGS